MLTVHRLISLHLNNTAECPPSQEFAVRYDGESMDEHVPAILLTCW